MEEGAEATRASPMSDVLQTIEDRMDEQGPPWGNSQLLARQVEDGYVAGYMALAIAKAYARFDDVIAALSDARRDDHRELQRVLSIAKDEMEKAKETKS